MKLGELISTRQADLDLSLEKLAVRARAKGFELTKATLSAYSNHDLTESPKRRTMEALAEALGVTFGEIVMAVAESIAGGASPSGETSATSHVRSWLTLTSGRSDTEVANLLRVARSAAEAIDAAQSRETPTREGDDGTERPAHDTT